MMNSQEYFGSGVSRIALIRHGVSAHVENRWIDAVGFRAWREAYEAAGIREGERVPEGLAELVSGGVVVASNAQRAIESARLISAGREVVVSPLLRELDLEGPEWGRVRLPLLGWGCAVGGRMFVRKLRGNYPSEEEQIRIDDAAAWLGGLSRENELVAVVTHASFRGLLAKRLLEMGWVAEAGKRTWRPWSDWWFRRDG